MIVVTRYRVPETIDAGSFLADADVALDALGACPGFLAGRIGRALDDLSLWTLTMEGADVGSSRRALSAYDVKLRSTPFLPQALDEPSAYEVLGAGGEGAN